MKEHFQSQLPKPTLSVPMPPVKLPRETHPSSEQQTYFLRMQGRCANGSERDAGKLVHAIRSAGFPGWRSAVCGAKPGRKGNGWSENDAGIFTAATCPRCVRKLS